MDLSPPSEAGSCAATQDLPSIYGTGKFIYAFTRALH
jgi:hypothetical protein